MAGEEKEEEEEEKKDDSILTPMQENLAANLK